MIEYKVIVDDYGDTCWYKAGTYIKHREDGPAVEYASGTRVWYRDDKVHREDGPAKEYSNGSKSWYLNDIIYRKEADWKIALNPPQELTLGEISARLGYEVKIVKS